jgi:hypothetical protein
MNGNAFAILWSPQQDAFHVETVEAMLEANRRIYAHRKGGDFIALGFAATHEEATEVVNTLIAQRDDAA